MSVSQKVIKNRKSSCLLGKIYQEEVAGVTRYLHYSFMIMGYNQFLYKSGFRDNANEAMMHAIVVEEKNDQPGQSPTYGRC